MTEEINFQTKRTDSKIKMEEDLEAVDSLKGLSIGDNVSRLDEIGEIFGEKKEPSLTKLREDMPETVEEMDEEFESKKSVDSDNKLERENEDEAESEDKIKPEKEIESEDKAEPEKEIESEDKVEPEKEIESDDTVEPEKEIGSEDKVEPEKEIESEDKVEPEKESEDKIKPEKEIESEEGRRESGDEEVKPEAKEALDTATEKIPEDTTEDIDAEKEIPEAEEDKAIEPVPDKPEDEQLEIKSTSVKSTTSQGIIRRKPIDTATSRVTIAESRDTLSKRYRQKRSFSKAKISYYLHPRFREEDDLLRRPSGDFRVVDDTTEFKYYSYMDEAEEEEEEEIVEEEEKEPMMDREPYYEKHKVLSAEITVQTIRNTLLQKKLAVFYKKRKMDHVLRESDQVIDTQQRYGRKLDMYGKLLEMDSSQRTELTEELNILKEKRQQKTVELNKLFRDMQEREKEIGYGLINTKTGNTIPDKLIERMIYRQKVQMEQVCQMRLKYIILKGLVAEKQDAIAALDNIGEGLHLMDYEQLKVENRSYSDKIEERDEELTRLRFKCQNTIQILAHIREKSAALESDIDDLKYEISIMEQMGYQVREHLNDLKQERDHYRLLINKVKNESGLLTEPELLRDMEYSIKELKSASSELDMLKQENQLKKHQIRNIRRNIEFASEGFMKRTASKIPAEKPLSHQHRRLFKGRPSLMKPSLPDNAFAYLEDFKPSLWHAKNKK